jgi:hypothetical protein
LFTALQWYRINNICETIAPASPITDQWNATAGKIQIFTTAVKTLNETEQYLFLVTIMFSRISLSQKQQEQVYETFW